MKSKALFMLVCLVTLSLIGVAYYASEASACKVLVVQSYSEPFFWSQDQKTGIEKVLKDRCELKYLYLDEDVAPDKIQEKGQQAYSVYQDWQPDGVIAGDDAVQIGFVVPYLKEKVATPVIFSGLFAPEAFGYPSANVTGAKQVPRYEETVTFLLQLVPSVKTLGMVVPDLPITRIGGPILEEILKKRSINAFPPFYSNNSAELLAKAAEWEPQIDALFTIPLIGEDVTRKLVSQFQKPTFSGWRQSVEWGVLCAVTDSGEELGRLAAEMMVKVLDGTPIAQLPITQNEFGRRMINVKTLKALGIEPSRRLLTGVELIKE